MLITKGKAITQVPVALQASPSEQSTLTKQPESPEEQAEFKKATVVRSNKMVCKNERMSIP
ncbi:MAG: hypothetical protein KAI66_25335 [Lentisphaeria bacterium]|nr:hypothetical protein [Lentisphaeria bacterium]